MSNVLPYSKTRKAYYRANCERIKAAARLKRANSPRTESERAAYNAQQREKYALNKEKTLARMRAAYAENPNKKNAKVKVYRLKNREKFSEYQKRWIEENREHINQYHRERNKQNPMRHRVIAMRHYQKVKHTPEYRAAQNHYGHVRRAREKNVTVNPRLIREFETKIRSTSAVKCYHCGEKVNGKLAHMDHILPIAKGGAHSIENLCVSCPDCNSRKKDFLPTEWNLRKTGQMILCV